MKRYHAVGIAICALVIIAAALSGCTSEQLQDSATVCDIAAKVIGCVAEVAEQ